MGMCLTGHVKSSDTYLFLCCACVSLCPWFPWHSSGNFLKLFILHCPECDYQDVVIPVLSPFFCFMLQVWYPQRTKGEIVVVCLCHLFRCSSHCNFTRFFWKLWGASVWKRNFISFLRSGLPSTLIKREEFENAGFVFPWGRLNNFEKLVLKNFLKTKLLKDNDFTLIMCCPCPSFPQSQIQIYRCKLLRFQISPAECERKTFWRIFSVKHCFQIFHFLRSVDRA